MPVSYLATFKGTWGGIILMGASVIWKLHKFRHHQTVSIDHTLSIWLKMEFTRNIFLKTSVCTDYFKTTQGRPC